MTTFLSSAKKLTLNEVTSLEKQATIGLKLYKTIGHLTP